MGPERKKVAYANPYSCNRIALESTQQLVERFPFDTHFWQLPDVGKFIQNLEDGSIIVTLGGDGTFSRIAWEIIKSGKNITMLPVAVSGNPLAKATWGIERPKDPIAFINDQLKKADQVKPQTLGLARIGQFPIHFISQIGSGLSAQFMHQDEQKRNQNLRRLMANLFPQSAYLLALGEILIHSKQLAYTVFLQRDQLQIEADGQRVIPDFPVLSLVGISIASSYGGIQFKTESQTEPTANQLNLMLIGGEDDADALRKTIAVFALSRLGLHQAGQTRIQTVQAKHFCIQTETDQFPLTIPLEVDGTGLASSLISDLPIQSNRIDVTTAEEKLALII